MENKKIEALRKSKAKVEAGIAQIDNALEQMKGQSGEQTSKKREGLNRRQEQLRAIRERISAEIKKLDDAPSDASRIEEEIQILEKQIESKKEAIGAKIDAIREKLDSVIGDNDLLKRLLAKERVQFKLRWNREMVAVLGNQDQIEEINQKNAELEKRLKKYDEDFSDAMDGVVDKFKENPVAQVATDAAEEEMKAGDEKMKELARLKEKLESAETDAAKEGIQDRIDDLENEGKSDEEKRLLHNIKNAKKALDSIQGKSKEAQGSKEAAQMIIDNYEKQLARIQKKKDEENASKETS